MRTLSYYQRAWDDRHPDDHRTAADDAAEQAAECMADFDRREAERIEVRHEICELERVSELHAVHVAAQEELLARMRECEICGMPAQEMGTEPRCEAHDSEVER